MLAWLVPLSLFWTLAATFLGGWPVDVAGGSALKQVVGLLVGFVLYLLVWWALHTALGFVGTFGGLILATALSAVLLPGIFWVAFRIFGIRIVRAEAH